MDEKTILDCPVCLETYDEGLHIPKMMPCLHTICAACIVSLASTTKQLPHAPAGGKAESTTHQPSIINRNSHTSSITALASVIQGSRDHPALRRLSGTGPLLSLPRQPNYTPVSFSSSPSPAAVQDPLTKTRTANLVSLKRPVISPPLPPKPSTVVIKEIEVPKDIVLECPLCRTEINTTKLQTNRYVLAHMKDLARINLHLSGSPSTRPQSDTATTPTSTQTTTPDTFQPPSPAFLPEGFWCVDCKRLAQSSCYSHDYLAVMEWVKGEMATVERQKATLEKELSKHITHLRKKEAVLKIVFRTLNKASRCLWNSGNEAMDVREKLNNQPPLPDIDNPQELTDMLKQKVVWMQGLAERMDKLKDSDADTSDIFTSIQENGKLYIKTSGPDRTLTVTITEGATV